MERKSIFEILASKTNYYSEIMRIEALMNTFIDRGFTLKASINQVYTKWKYRESTISVEDFYRECGYEHIEDPGRMSAENAINYFLTYNEMIQNLILVFFKYNKEYMRADKIDTLIFSIIENIKLCIGKLGYEVYVYKDEEHAIVVQTDAAAVAVAEIIDEANAVRVMEYNQLALKGNLEGKRNILKNLADLFEGKRNSLKSNNLEGLSSDIGYLLNNYDLRHNNIKGNIKNKYLETITPEELELWYDKTYKLILISILDLEKIKLQDDVVELKKKVGNGDAKNTETVIEDSGSESLEQKENKDGE